MDDVTKSSIRLAHWSDHNLEHLKGYAEVADSLDKAGRVEAARMMREAITLIQQANLLFERTLDSLRTETPTEDSSDTRLHTHEHPHKHIHEHPHTHTGEHRHEHHHDHIHEHAHEGSTDNSHEHCHESCCQVTHPHNDDGPNGQGH
ncbi:MAG: hypothetical protein QG577_1507 [Thermodesulfobacteriota bacterium]|nr:hypothetical protein [Thermodesulfobacteriota bacterium]